MIFKKRSFAKTNNKYNALSCTCKLDHKHDSKDEASYCNKLNLLLRAGEIKSFETQVNFPLYVNDKKVTTMRIDFMVINNDNSISYHEYKGFATPVFRLKWKLLQALYPELDYQLKTKKDLLK